MTTEQQRRPVPEDTANLVRYLRGLSMLDAAAALNEWRSRARLAPEGLARLQEPDVFQAARVAAEVAWHDRNLDGCSHWEKMEASVRAVLDRIAEMLT